MKPFLLFLLISFHATQLFANPDSLWFQSKIANPGGKVLSKDTIMEVTQWCCPPHIAMGHVHQKHFNLFLKTGNSWMGSSNFRAFDFTPFSQDQYIRLDSLKAQTNRFLEAGYELLIIEGKTRRILKSKNQTKLEESIKFPLTTKPDTSYFSWQKQEVSHTQKAIPYPIKQYIAGAQLLYNRPIGNLGIESISIGTGLNRHYFIFYKKEALTALPLQKRE